MKKVTLSNAKKEIGLHFTTNHSGKMEGMLSLSTCCANNETCKRRAAVKGSICSHCYAMRQMKVYKNMIGCLTKNFDVLSSSVIPVDRMPILNCLVFRFESFGDLGNVNQVKNYFNLCYKNPNVRFALWTKNLWFVKQAIEDGYEKPSNLTIVFSAMFVNQIIKLDRIKAAFPFVDKVFQVFDNEYIENNDIVINCGANNCFTCQKCYHKDNGIDVINEKLK